MDASPKQHVSRCKVRQRILAFFPLLGILALHAEDPPASTLNDPAFWKPCHATPASWPATELDATVQQRADETEVRALFYAGASYQGNPTRVFALYGAPPPEKRGPDGRVPGIVLVYGTLLFRSMPG